MSRVMNDAKILFLGSGPFGLPTLDMLARLPGISLAVATVPPAPRGRRGTPQPTCVEERASALEIPCFQVDTLKRPHGAELLAQWPAELVMTADIRLWIPPSFYQAPARGAWNLHGSLLPRWRGAAPVARAILAGDFEFGVTLYRIVKDLDAGPMVAHHALAPAGKRTTPEVEDELAERAADLCADWLPRLLAGDFAEQPQNDAAVTLAPRLGKDDGWIDWQLPADAIENHVLALKPWPRSFTHWHPATGGDPVRLFVEIVTPVSDAGAQSSEEPGTVRAVSAAGVDVACGSGGNDTLRLVELQRAGKRCLPAGEFVRGCPLAVGDRLATPVAPESTP